MLQLVGMELSVCRLMRQCCCHTLFSCDFAQFLRNCRLSQNIAVKSIGWVMNADCYVLIDGTHSVEMQLVF